MNNRITSKALFHCSRPQNSSISKLSSSWTFKRTTFPRILRSTHLNQEWKFIARLSVRHNENTILYYLLFKQIERERENEIEREENPNLIFLSTQLLPLNQLSIPISLNVITHRGRFCTHAAELPQNPLDIHITYNRTA